MNVDSTQINLSGRITTTGDITLDADAESFAPGLVLTRADRAAAVNVSGTTAQPTVLTADNVTIEATANNDNNMVGSIPGVGTLTEILASLRPFIGLAVAEETTDITISGDTSIDAFGTVTIDGDSESKVDLHLVSLVACSTVSERGCRVQFHRRYRLGRDHQRRRRR